MSISNHTDGLHGDGNYFFRDKWYVFLNVIQLWVLHEMTYYPVSKWEGP